MHRTISLALDALSLLLLIVVRLLTETSREDVGYELMGMLSDWGIG
jgi:hypothetical protein